MKNRVLPVLQESFVQTSLKKNKQKNPQKPKPKPKNPKQTKNMRWEEKRKGITGTRKERITQKTG